MANTRKYPKTTGYFVYAHITPNKEVYIGMSKRQPCRRWKPLLYKAPNSLAKYIEQYGWENIEHKVLIDGLSKKQAEQVEDWFIRKATADGFCINKNRSGGLWRDDKQSYKRQWEEDHKEHCKQYRKEHNEERKAYDKQRLSTIEGRIYCRVKSYNRYHPDKAIETPKEAKQKYLEFGYIPSYIKNDDLK